MSDLVSKLGPSGSTSRVIVGAVTAALCTPFAAGLIRCAREFGVVLGGMALPGTVPTRVDLADAPRRALVVTLQLNVLLLVGAPLVALTQPFLPAFYGAVVLVAALLLFGISFWRSAANLQGHARAGAQMIVEALMTRAHGPRPSIDAHALDPVHELLPGLGTPSPLRLTATSHAVGKTLAKLNLRGLTGAAVLAIVRDDGAVIVPTGKETLRANDVLAIAGTREAIAAAALLLLEGRAADPASDGAHE